MNVCVYVFRYAMCINIYIYICTYAYPCVIAACEDVEQL